MIFNEIKPKKLKMFHFREANIKSPQCTPKSRRAKKLPGSVRHEVTHVSNDSGNVTGFGDTIVSTPDTEMELQDGRTKNRYTRKC